MHASRHYIDQTPYEYPAHLRDLVASIPDGPGVYLFYGAAGNPLYVGKSINVRTRLLSHLRNPDEARMLKQTMDIETRSTAGEIGALLLESRLIKELQPLHNKRLRKTRRLCSITFSECRTEIVDTTTRPTRPLYGLFRSRKAASEALCNLANEFGLCLGLLGLERHAAGRACFRQQIGKCRGACVGLESQEQHRHRTEEALGHWKLEHWPYDGAIVLHEQHGEHEDFHLIDQWHYFGSFATLSAAREAQSRPPGAFDADCYRILVRPIIDTHVPIIELAPPPHRVSAA